MLILVTGATGLIGGELVSQLLSQGHAIIALAHKQPEIRANNGRLIPASAIASGWPQAGQVAIVNGDITAADLNIDRQLYARLCAKSEMIIHCAAMTDFGAADAEYQSVNVMGTANMLALSPNIPFLHVSTAYVCGTADGKIAEKPLSAQRTFTNGYEASKAAAEEHVLAAPNPSVIARPGIVVGRHACGTIGSFDNFYRLFKLMAEGRITKLPAAADATVDLVPIDHVVSALCDLVRLWPDAAGQIYHLTSGQATALSVLTETMRRIDGISSPDIIADGAYKKEDLERPERRLHEKFLTQYSGYLQRAPIFQADALASLSSRQCPRMDGPALERQIRYCLDSGFITTRH